MTSVFKSDPVTPHMRNARNAVAAGTEALNDGADRMREAVAAGAEKVSNHAAKLRDEVSDGVEQFQHGTSYASREVQDALKGLEKALKSGRKNLRRALSSGRTQVDALGDTKLSGIARSVGGVIRRHPGKILAVSLTIGVLVWARLSDRA